MLLLGSVQTRITWCKQKVTLKTDKELERKSVCQGTAQATRHGLQADHTLHSEKLGLEC